MAVPTLPLANGVELPQVGIGLDQVRDGDLALSALAHAFQAGYRSIDTASSYGNEEYVGKAIRESSLPRSQLYVTTKVPGADHGRDATLRSFQRSLDRLGTDYLDQYLIHWPGKYLYVETRQALEELYQSRRVRAIGVCNFTIRHLERLASETSIVPMVNRVEWHPYFQQPELAAYCAERQILIEAWSPLMCGGDVLADPVIGKIPARVSRSPAQVILRWHVQSGRRVFPKSTTASRILDNISLFDFALSGDDMAAIDALGAQALRIGPDPDIFFMV